jgi:hypothetical protein
MGQETSLPFIFSSWNLMILYLAVLMILHYLIFLISMLICLWRDIKI